MEELETIVITFEDGDEVEFFVLEQTELMGTIYYLVAPVEDEEDEEEEGECFILKENTNADKDDEFGVYEFVEDEEELESLLPIFEEVLGDDDVEVEF